MPIRPGEHLVGARLRPGALPVLTGVGAAALRDADLSLGTLDGDGDGLGARIDALARLLLPVVSRLPDGARQAQAACRAVDHRARQPVIGALADELGLRERSLRSLFATYVGTSPKSLHQVRRLQHVLRLAAREPRLRLGELAAQGGFADQAHLSRQCRALAGLTPTTLVSLVRA